MRAVLATVAAAGAILGALLSSESGAQSGARASATALVASGSVGPQVEAAASGHGAEKRAGGVQADALTVGSGEAIARTSITGHRARARASAVARSVSALDGLVTAYGARREMNASASGLVYEGRVDGLKIDGEMVGTVTGAQTFELPDGAGTVTANQGGAALRIVLSKARAGQPAGTELRIAVVNASARQGRRPERTATPQPEATPQRTAEPAREPRTRRPKRSGRSKGGKPKERKAPAHLRAGGYAFPVYGDGVTVADDWGGPRQIGPHRGNDIFAPFGSPVLAVADGTLRKVGTLDISGNRLWLVADNGDAFFYAHLASFAALAEGGRRVKAGDVLGFVGNTGDAEPTPPHVHFEIHPGGIDTGAVDPHETLLNWQQRQDVEPSAWLRRVGRDATARPGALVEVRDFIAGE